MTELYLENIPMPTADELRRALRIRPAFYKEVRNTLLGSSPYANVNHIPIVIDQEWVPSLGGGVVDSNDDAAKDVGLMKTLLRELGYTVSWRKKTDNITGHDYEYLVVEW